MKHFFTFFTFTLLLSSGASTANAEETKPYTLMKNDLIALKADFNAAVDQVRLVFIVGPT